MAPSEACGSTRSSGRGARPNDSSSASSSPTSRSAQPCSTRTNWRTGRQSSTSLAIRIRGTSSGRPVRLSDHRGAGAAPASASAWRARKGALGSTSQSSAAASMSGRSRKAFRASQIRVPSPGPTSARTSRAGRPIRVQVSPAQRPISSPNICDTRGAVMKSPSAPSRGRVA